MYSCFVTISNVFILRDKQVRCNRVELLFCFLRNIDVAFQILLYFCATIKVMYVGYKNESRRLL